LITKGFITFGPVTPTACWSPENVMFYLDYACCKGSLLESSSSSSQSQPQPLCPTCGEIGETTPIRVDGGFLTNQYLINMPSTTEICYLTGIGFGIDENGEALYDIEDDGSAENNKILYANITTVDGSEAIGGNGNNTSAIYDQTNQSAWVLYNDVNTEKTTLRKGALKFREAPDKYELFLGDETRDKVSVAGDEITLDPSKGDRLNRLSFNVSRGSVLDAPLTTFSINDPTNSYGIPISGHGDVDLQALRFQGILPGDLSSDVYLDENNMPVSPVYVYPACSVQQASRQKIGMSIPTEQEDGNPTKIYINGLATLSNLEGTYVDDEDVEDGGGGFLDLFRMNDGSICLLYTKRIGEFNVKRETGTLSLENSPDNGSQWQRQKAVMMIKTDDLADVWTAPFEFDQRKPLMILNGVDYLSSVYDDLNERLLVFVRVVF